MSGRRLEPRLRTMVEHVLGAHPEMGHLRERLAKVHAEAEVMRTERLEQADRSTWPTD